MNFRSLIWIFEVFDYLSIQIYVQKTHADNVSENKLYLNAFIIFEVVEVSKIQVRLITLYLICHAPPLRCRLFIGENDILVI